MSIFSPHCNPTSCCQARGLTECGSPYAPSLVSSHPGRFIHLPAPQCRAPAAVAPVLSVLQRETPARCTAARGDVASILREAMAAGPLPPADEAYRSGAVYLQGLGISSQGEVTRILDVAMNPNSLYGRYRDKKRAVNISARKLSVEADIKPVVQWLESSGFERQQVLQIIAEHPPVLSYSPAERLQPFVEFLKGTGIRDPAAVILRRPTLLGLDVDSNLRRIVDYLLVNDYTVEQIEEYLATTI